MYNKDKQIIAIKQKELQSIKDKVQESTVSDVNVIIVNKKERRRIWNDSYGFYNQKAIMELLTQISPTELQVLMYCMGKCNYGNIVDIRRADLANDLEISESTIKRSTNNLCSDNVLRRVKMGRNNYYIIDPSISFKGNTTERFALSELLDSGLDLQIVVNESNKLEVAIK